MADSKKSGGKNANDLLRENRSLIVKQMMRLKRCSRSDLASITGLTQAAITKIVNGLLHMNILEESCVEKNGRGRSKILLTLKRDCIRIIGVTLSRKSFSTAVYDITGNIYTSDKTSISPDEPLKQIVNKIIKIIRRYCADYPNIIAVGVAVPGPFLREIGCFSKITGVSGWDNYNIVDALSNGVSIPVFVEHDANAAALAEWWFGEISPTSLISLQTNEGIGAGIINHGKLLLGKDGIAGEIGHMSIDLNGRFCHCAPNRRGCLEQYCSSSSFERDVLQGLSSHPESCLYSHLAIGSITSQDVFIAASSGDAYADYMVSELAKYMAVGISNLVSAYNPQTIVINNPMSFGGDLLLNRIKEEASKLIFPALYDRIVIRFSALPVDAIQLGAMVVAADRFLNNPAAYVPQTLGSGKCTSERPQC